MDDEGFCRRLVHALRNPGLRYLAPTDYPFLFPTQGAFGYVRRANTGYTPVHCDCGNIKVRIKAGSIIDDRAEVPARISPDSQMRGPECGTSSTSTLVAVAELDLQPD